VRGVDICLYVTMVLQGCYKGVTTGFLSLCNMGIRGGISVILECYLRVLQECYKGVTRVSQERYKGVTRVFYWVSKIV
jgi:hypothetical protein